MTPDVLASTLVDAKRRSQIVSAEPSQICGIPWTFVVRNRSSTVAYRDPLCEMRYFDSAGNVVETRGEMVWLLVQPGETRRATVEDGARWASGWVKADLRVANAQPIRPVTH